MIKKQNIKYLNDNLVDAFEKIAVQINRFVINKKIII